MGSFVVAGIVVVSVTQSNKLLIVMNVRENAKSFLRYKALCQGGPDLPFLSPQPDTCLHCPIMHGYTASASHGVSVYAPAFAGTHWPTHGWMARLS